MSVFQVDLLPRPRVAVLVLRESFKLFTAVTDRVVVHFEPADVLVTTRTMRWLTASRANGFQVLRVCDLHDFVLVAVPAVILAYAQ